MIGKSEIEIGLQMGYNLLIFIYNYSKRLLLRQKTPVQIRLGLYFNGSQRLPLKYMSQPFDWYRRPTLCQQAQRGSAGPIGPASNPTEHVPILSRMLQYQHGSQLAATC